MARKIYSWKENVLQNCTTFICNITFRCLDSTGGMIVAHPERVSKIIVACGLLHNICVNENIPIRHNPDGHAMEGPHRRRARVNANVFAPAGVNLQQDPTGAIIREWLGATRLNRWNRWNAMDTFTETEIIISHTYLVCNLQKKVCWISCQSSTDCE